MENKLTEINMVNPQVENGYTKIANELFEALMQTNLSPYESRVLYFILRKTYGFNRKTDWFTLSQFSKATGLDRRLIHRALKRLSGKRIIVIHRDDKYKIRYGFQKDYSKWKPPVVISRDDTGSEKEIEMSSVEMITILGREDR